jgi:hypothetical protein
MKVIKNYNLFLEKLSGDKNGIYYDNEYKYEYKYEYNSNTIEIKKKTHEDVLIDTTSLDTLIEANEYYSVELLLKNVDLDINKPYMSINISKAYYILDASTIDMLKLLIKNGCDINSVNSENDSLFSYFWDKHKNLFFLLDNDIDWELPVAEYKFIDYVFMKNEEIFDIDSQIELNNKLKERYPEKYNFYKKKYKSKKFNI